MNIFKSAGHATGIVMLASVFFSSCTNRAAVINPGTDTAQVIETALPPLPGTPISYDSSKRYIYLTWDDSPQPGTANCRKVFREEGVKATFFAVNLNQGDHNSKVLDSIRNEYPLFLLANHSYSHGFRNRYERFYAPAMTDSAVDDFMKNEEKLRIPVRILRFPGHNTWVNNGVYRGQKTDRPLVKKLDSLGYHVVGWDMEWSQASRGGAKVPRESVSQMIHRLNYKLDNKETMTPGSVVILSHDRLFHQQQYADSLRKFVAMLKQDPRNVFETIDHYPLVQKKP